MKLLIVENNPVHIAYSENKIVIYWCRDRISDWRESNGMWEDVLNNKPSFSSRKHVIEHELETLCENLDDELYEELKAEIHKHFDFPEETDRFKRL